MKMAISNLKERKERDALAQSCTSTPETSSFLPSGHGDVVKEGQIRVHGPADHLARFLPSQLFHCRVVVLLALREEHFQHSALVLGERKVRIR